MAPADTQTDPARADYAPEGTDRRTTAFATVKRTATEFIEDGLMDWGAALTYYGLLSLFPALLAFVGIFGLVADPADATRTITDIVTQIGPESAADTFSGPIESITSSSATSATMVIVGTWSACGRRRATSAPSSARRTSSMRPPRDDRSGSCAQCSSRSPW